MSCILKSSFKLVEKNVIFSFIYLLFNSPTLLHLCWSSFFSVNVTAASWGANFPSVPRVLLLLFSIDWLTTNYLGFQLFENNFYFARICKHWSLLEQICVHPPLASVFLSPGHWSLWWQAHDTEYIPVWWSQSFLFAFLFSADQLYSYRLCFVVVFVCLFVFGKVCSNALVKFFKLQEELLCHFWGFFFQFFLKSSSCPIFFLPSFWDLKDRHD